MLIVVHHLQGSRAGATETFSSTPLTIGRDPSNQLAFDPERDLDVSSAHAVINRTPIGLELVDLGSTNGTFLNGQRVTGSVPLGCPAVIALGKDGVRLQVSMQQMLQPVPMRPQPMLPPAPPPAPRKPGAKTVMLQDLTRKQRGTRRLLVVLGCLSLLCIPVGLLLAQGYLDSFEQHQTAEAHARAINAQRRAAGAREVVGAAAELEAAEEELERAEELEADGDYAAASLAYISAEFGFQEAARLAAAAENVVVTAAAEDARIDAFEKDIAALEKALIAAAQQPPAPPPADPGAPDAPEPPAAAPDPRPADVLADVRSARELFASLVGKSPWVVCRLTSTPWLMRGSQRAARLAEPVVGCGVFLGEDRILTTKSLALPHHHLPAAKAYWMRYLQGSRGTYEVVVETRAEVLVPLAADEGLSSAWRVLFSTDDGSLRLTAHGREDQSELTAPEEVTIQFEHRSERVSGVQVYRENAENWALFRYDRERPFEGVQGRKRLKEIAGGLQIAGQERSEEAAQPLDGTLLLSVEAGAIHSLAPSVQSAADGGFVLGQPYREGWLGAPIFGPDGKLLGLAVGPAENGLRAVGLAHIDLP